MKRANSILVPIDFSNDSRLALRMADYQAHQWGTGLILLYVDRGIVGLPMKKNPLLDFVRHINHTAAGQIVCINCVGEPVSTIVQVAEHYKVRAIFMGYGAKGEHPGPVATGVKLKFDGLVELFSETMAGLISQVA